MDLSNLELIARAAETACVAVIDRPKDVHVREQLFNALAAVVDPAFEGDDDTASPYLNDLLSQARVWAALVRSRIDSVWATKGGYAKERARRSLADRFCEAIKELTAERQKPAPALRSGSWCTLVARHLGIGDEEGQEAIWASGHRLKRAGDRTLSPDLWMDRRLTAAGLPISSQRCTRTRIRALSPGWYRCRGLCRTRCPRRSRPEASGSQHKLHCRQRYLGT